MARLSLEFPPPPRLPLGVHVSSTALCDLLPSHNLLFCPTSNGHPLRTAPNLPQMQLHFPELWGGGEGLLLLLLL